MINIKTVFDAIMYFAFGFLDYEMTIIQNHIIENSVFTLEDDVNGFLLA